MKIAAFGKVCSLSFCFSALGLGITAAISGCGGGGSSSAGGGSTTTPAPAVSSISPAKVTAGSSALSLTITGSGFSETSAVQVGGTTESSTYGSSTQLTATVPASQLVSGAELAVVVLDGSVISSPINLEVDNPTPAITSVAPASELTGATPAVITVTGTGFVPTTVINVNGAARSTTFTSSTQVSVALTAADVAAATSLSLTAVNPTPGGGTSTATAVAVVAANPSPTLSALNPASLVVGAASPVITVTGTNFLSSTVIEVNGSARSTTIASATQASVTLTAADVSSAGSLSFTAVNPAPGGGGSDAIALPIYNPTVGALQLNPSTLTAGTTSPTTVTVTGNTFVPTSVVQVNGAARVTTYMNATTLTFVATVADQATAGTLTVTVTNPAPGGGTSPATTLAVAAAPVTPVVASVVPNPLIVGSGDTLITVSGSGFAPNSVVQWNDAPLVTTLGYYYGGTQLTATVPASDLTAAGTAAVTVNTPNATPPLSNSVTVTITNPPAPTLTSLYPGGGPINTEAAVTLTGTGFTASTTVAVNGAQIASTYVNPTQITATIPASSLAFPGNANVTVTTPAPGGGTAAPLPFTTFIQIPNNDIVYNPTDGLLYASVPSTGDGVNGNSVAGLDPTTGNVMRQIWVGSNPDKLALSTDGTQLFVVLDGASAVAQVNLTTGGVANQFSLSGSSGTLNLSSTAEFLAAVPGSPNSVAVATNNAVTIYDSGVARANTSSSLNVGIGPLSFGSSSSILYMSGSPGVEQLTVGPTGITAAAKLGTYDTNATNLQYDNGNLYLSSGAVLSASTGALLGTFYSSATTAANGPIVSDSTLGRAFMGVSSVFSNTTGVLAFDETSYNLLGTIPANAVGSSGYPSSFAKIVRWGQNGVALNDPASYLNNNGQIFIFQSPLVKDISSSPADLSVTLTAPATATTGTAISWVATVDNLGPNAAQDATAALNLDSSLIIDSITPSQGSCGTGATFSCDLGSLANGASATVTVSATPTNSGTLAGTASVSSVSYDPTLTNNQATTSTTVTGSLYGAVPTVASISPNFVQAGSAAFTLTVNGAGFNADSTVNLGTTALSTTYVSATQLTASVTATQIANYGWAAITVSNPTPGGGLSQIVPLTLYDVVNVPASGLLFDPWSQQLYATVPSTATTLTGNSVVTIDPVSGTVGTPVAVGSEPTVMAETSDGNYLYISLTGSDSLAQFNLLNQSLVTTIPLTLTQGGSSSAVSATWLSAMPGTDSTLAVTTTNTWGQFGIFDISGSTGAFRSNLGGIYAGSQPVFANASEVYASGFYRYTVNASGLTLLDSTSLSGFGSGGFEYLGGAIYGDSGGIANPATTPPAQIATLPPVDFYEPGIDDSAVMAVADPSLQKEFLMLENAAGTWEYALARYDLTTYLPDGPIVTMPASASGVDTAWTMLRFGQDGLAMLSLDTFGVGTPVPVVILLRGPFVAPQELASSTAATLTSSSATSIAHGAGNTLLTLTGSNFLPGVAVTWNGNYRTTTIVNASQVTVAIPASDLASAGTGSLVATNPGAPASNVLQVTLH